MSRLSLTMLVVAALTAPAAVGCREKTRTGSRSTTQTDRVKGDSPARAPAAVFGPSDTLTRTRTDLTRVMVRRNGLMAQALDLFRLDVSRYPTTEEGLKALLVKPEGDDDADFWRGPYLRGSEKDLKDPWGTNYLYVCPGSHNTDSYDLCSAGPDRRHGTDDDIANWRE